MDGGAGLDSGWPAGKQLCRHSRVRWRRKTMPAGSSRVWPSSYSPVPGCQTTGDVTLGWWPMEASGGALPGVRIQASSPSLQGIRVAVTGPDGMYRLPDASRDLQDQGHSCRIRTGEKTGPVSLDATATVNFTLTLGTRGGPRLGRGAARGHDLDDGGTNYVTRSSAASRSHATTPTSSGPIRASARTGGRRRGARSRSRSTARPRSRTSTSSTASTRQT